MGKTVDYRAKLKELKDWEPYLLKETGLPGPRGNIEPARPAAEEGEAEKKQLLRMDREWVEKWRNSL